MDFWYTLMENLYSNKKNDKAITKIRKPSKFKEKKYTFNILGLKKNCKTWWHSPFNWKFYFILHQCRSIPPRLLIARQLDTRFFIYVIKIFDSTQYTNIYTYVVHIYTTLSLQESTGTYLRNSWNISRKKLELEASCIWFLHVFMQVIGSNARC